MEELLIEWAEYNITVNALARLLSFGLVVQSQPINSGELAGGGGGSLTSTSSPSMRTS